MAAIKQEKTVWMKIEEADVVPNEPGPMVQPYPPSVYVKEEMEDAGYEEFSEDPLRIEEAHLHMKQEPQLKLDVDGSQCNFSEDPLHIEEYGLHMKQEQHLKLDMDGSERNFCEDPLSIEIPGFHIKNDPELNVDGSEHNFVENTLGTSWSTDFIKEVPEQVLEVDETENIVVASKRYASSMTRFTGNSEEGCDISYEGTVNEGVDNSKLEIDSEESAPIAMFVEEEEKQESLFATRLKCCLRENKFHKFSCSFCLQSFPSKYRLIMHVFIHIDGVHPPVFVCKSCGEVFPSHASLNKHLKMSEIDHELSADTEQKFDCSSEHGNSGSSLLEDDKQDSLMDQTERQYPSKGICKTSKKSFSEKCTKHSVTQSAEIQDRNDNAGTSYKAGNANVIPRKWRPRCYVCRKSFNNRGALTRHALIHTGMKAHSCTFCGKSFNRSDSLRGHLLIHTGIKLHKCDICDKSFTQKGYLKTHAILHTGIKPHQCDICGKSFSLIGHLKLHVISHKGRRPHKCNICDKSYSRFADLKVHALMHTGERPHKCKICGKSFTQISHRNTHALIHTGSHHKCNICGKFFTQIGNLKRHAIIHTRDAPHKCEICGKSYTLLSTLKKHSLTHAANKPH